MKIPAKLHRLRNFKSSHGRIFFPHSLSLPHLLVSHSHYAASLRRSHVVLAKVRFKPFKRKLIKLKTHLKWIQSQQKHSEYQILVKLRSENANCEHKLENKNFFSLMADAFFFQIANSGNKRAHFEWKSWLVHAPTCFN